MSKIEDFIHIVRYTRCKGDTWMGFYCGPDLPFEKSVDTKDNEKATCQSCITNYKNEQNEELKRNVYE